MAILVRKNDQVWLQAHRKPFAQEHELRDLLLKTPALIEVLDGKKLILTKEAGLSGGTSADLLGVTSDGDILIVEAKLAKNYDIRRKVIGQIFEYAARLWKTDYLTFRSYFDEADGQSLSSRFGANQEDFEEETFRNRVDNNLRQGRFQLLIAVDEMSEDLAKILSYISSRGESVRLEALEVHVFQSGETDILVPQRHAIAPLSQSSTAGAPTSVSLEQLLNKSVDSSMRAKLEILVEAWRASGNQVDLTEKTFCFKTQGSKRFFSMFWASPNEEWGLQPNFGGMSDAGLPEALIVDLRNKLSAIPGIPKERTLARHYSSLRFSKLPEESIRRFSGVMVETARLWHEHLQAAIGG